MLRKLLSTIALLLFLPAGIALGMNAVDKKDDRRKPGNDEDKHKPVIIIIWEPAWSPVMRETPLVEAIETFNPCYSENKNESL